jgi:hypothetical protein
MTIMSRILKRLTISWCKVNIELYESLNNQVISNKSSIKKILNILFLRQNGPSGMEEISIPRKYLRGPRSDIRN